MRVKNRCFCLPPVISLSLSSCRHVLRAPVGMLIVGFEPEVHLPYLIVTARCSDSEPMRTWSHERLLRRPTAEDSLLGRRRHVQGSGGPHLLRQPLLGQAL